jgi:hypothetical protein
MGDRLLWARGGPRASVSSKRDGPQASVFSKRDGPQAAVAASGPRMASTVDGWQRQEDFEV